MSVQLDPIIASKLEDFRRRRRNLIVLRGICTAIVTSLAVFSSIAIADYLSQARMPDELRTAFSYLGYAIVAIAVWRTCARLLIQLPSRRKLARLIEQAAPDLREDLLSAVELARGDGVETDSEVFRKLVQKNVSSKVKTLDMTSTLPLAHLRKWLSATAGLIVLTLILLYNPNFGVKFQRAIGRALMPGANIAAVTDVEVTILAPGEDVTVTPKSEPLRFLIAVAGKEEGQSFDRVELETRIAGEKQAPVGMSGRQDNQFSIDYNVEREKFEYRILVDNSPVTMNMGSSTAQWIEMDVASRPYVTSFTKTYNYPEYTKLESVTVTEDRGDLEGWEGTKVDLVLHLNQPTTGGTIELDLTGTGASKLELIPNEDGTQLTGTHTLRHPGTYRAVEITSGETGWKSKPSQAYEINVQLDEAPAIRIISPEERSVLAASDDIFPLTIAARDDLALEKIEYHVQVNKRGWKKLSIPGLPTPIDKKDVRFQFDLDLIDLRLKPNDQATLKLVAFDRKGSTGESEPIQLSIISRDLDLSALQTIKLKNMVIEGIAKLATSADARAKATIELYNSSLKNHNGPISPLVADELRSLSNSLAEESGLLLDKTLTALTAMPRGTDSLEISLLARSINSITQLRSGKALSRAETAIATDDSNIRKEVIQAFRGAIEQDRGLTGNLRNVTQVLLGNQVRAIGGTYLRQLVKNQNELEELLKGDYHYKSIVRRQEVAINHWRTIENVLKLSSASRSHIFRSMSKEENQLREALDGNETKSQRDLLARTVKSWNDKVRQIHDTENNRLRSTIRSSRSGRENFLWQIPQSSVQINDVSALVTAIESNPDYSSWPAAKGKWVERDLLSKIHGTALVSNIQGRARLEESRKDSDAPFVKDLGQTARALRRLIEQFGSQRQTGPMTKEEKDKIPEIRLVHEDWGSGNQADVLAVLRSTARQLFPYAERYDWNPINVGRSSDGPIVLFRRGDLGEYLVNLNTGDRYWAQYAFQFSHEIGHVLCGFREGEQSNHWFEEMLCETASLFALRKLSEEWKRNPPYPNWKSFAKSLEEYAQERIDRQPWPKELSLADWYAKEKNLLIEEANNRDRNLMVAIRILPFFEKNPAGWAACFALNKKKGKEKRSFETYLRDWHESCQTDEHRGFVQKIAKDFGYDFADPDPQVAATIEAVPMGGKFREIKDIFKLLETYHEAMDALGLASTFANKERWEMVKSDNRAERAIHWGATAAPWRILSSRVASIPYELLRSSEARTEAGKILRELPKQDYAKNIDEEMEQRVENMDRAPQSVAKEVESVQADLRRVIKLLSPAVNKAREKLNQLAPSLPELARQLAKKARKAKAQSETIAGKPEDEPAEVRQETTELQREQRLLGNEIVLFNAALRQEANVQNVLDKEGREIARDADDAAALVQDRQNAAANAIAQALQASDRGSQNENLEKASEKQGELAEALEAIADHFERVQEDQEVAESREDLRQVEKDLGIKEQVDEQFDQAERLAELAKLSAEELLAELEKELTDNKPMQQELSDIAEDAVEEAQQALEEAAKEEDEIAEDLENTDKEVVDEKKKLAKELDKLALEIKRLADREVRQASHLARQASAGESFEELTESREELLDIAEEAKAGAKPEEAIAELAQTAQDLVEPLLGEAEDLAEAAQSAEEVSKLNPETAKEQAEQTETTAQEAKEQAVQAGEKASVAEAKAEQASQEAEQAIQDAVKSAQDAAFAEQQAEQAAQQAAQQPDSQTAQNDARQAIEEAQQAKQEANQAKQSADEAQQQANELAQQSNSDNETAQEAQEEAEEARQNADFAQERAERKPSQFASSKRNAERAQQEAQKASEKASELAQQAQELAEKIDALGENASPDTEALSQAQEQQQEVGENVFDAAQDIERAARHEERLGNEQASEALSEIAENTEQAAQDEVAQAGQELQNEQLAQQLDELAQEGQEIAQSQQAQQAAKQNQQAQDAQESLQEAGQQAQESAESQPDFQELGEAAQEFAEETQSAAEEFSEAAEQGQQQAQQAQQQAQQAKQQAQQAQQQAQQAKQQAQQAQQQAQQEQQQAQQAQQQASSQPENAEAQEAAQEAGQQAQQAQQSAEKAGQQAQQAQQAAQEAGQQAQQAQQAAQEAGQQAQAGEQAAQEAAELAEAAETFSESFPSEPAFAENGSEDSPESSEGEDSGFGEALASAEQALGEQAEALASLGEESGQGEGQQPGEPQSGEGQPSESGQSEPSEGQGEGQPSEGQSESGQGEPSEGQGQPGEGQPSQPGESPPSGQGSPSPSSGEAPLTNPETAQALAQTLDSLDQALNAESNPFGQEAVPSEGGTPSDSPLSEAAQSAQQGQPGEGQPGEGPPGQGQPGQGQPSQQESGQSSQAAQAQALAEAAQALAQATMAQASSMAQSRMQSQNAMTQGFQPNSGEGAAVDSAPITDFLELPIADLENNSKLEWSRLPPKLAKDLMDGRREAVSGEYRNRVEAYFRAMAEKSRKKK
ncbi:MAG: hypothetical protein HN531_03880 [Opitutae bacterium]|nr:hypothetical protein [Opitutae bacterium]